MVRTAPALFVFCLVQIGVHLALILAAGRALRFSRRDVLLASNANVGGEALGQRSANAASMLQCTVPTASSSRVRKAQETSAVIMHCLCSRRRANNGGRHVRGQRLADQHGAVAPHWHRRSASAPCHLAHEDLPPQRHSASASASFCSRACPSFTLLSLTLRINVLAVWHAGYAVATFLCIPLGELVLRRLM